MKHKSEDEVKKQTPVYAGGGLAVGAALGTIFGLLLFDEIALGAGIGAAVGLIIGAIIDAQANRNKVE